MQQSKMQCAFLAVDDNKDNLLLRAYSNSAGLIHSIFDPRIFISNIQNQFAVRKGFQNFLVGKDCKVTCDCISFLVNSLDLWLDANFENIDPVIQKVKGLPFPM